MLKGCFGNTVLLLIQVFFGLLSILIGFVTFTYYLFKYEDYNASIWGLLLAITSLSVVHLHLLFLKAQIDVWYDKHTFTSLIKFALLLSILAIIAIPIYIYFAVEKNEEITLRGYHVSAILAILALFWSLNLLFTSRLYKKYVQLIHPGLLSSRESINQPYTFYVDTF